MRNTLIHLLGASPLSARAIARRAGVSASTITRITNGALDPSLGTAEAILRALGHQPPTEFSKLCDIGALSAARTMMSGHETPPGWGQTLARWVGPQGSSRDLAALAGRAAPPELRPGVQIIRTDWNILRVYGAIDAAVDKWVASGWPAAGDPMQGMHGVPLQVYVDCGYSALGLALPHDPAGRSIVQVLPFDGVSEAEPWPEDEIPWANPHQVLLDLYGSPETALIGDQYFDILEADPTNT